MEAADEAPRTSCRKGRHSIGSWRTHSPAGVESPSCVGSLEWAQGPGVLAICPIAIDRVEQARTSGIIRFPTPHDRGGGPCLPAHLARSRRAWPGFAMPARSRKPSPRTCSSTWPPSPTRGVPWAAVRLGFPHAAQVIQVTRKRPSASRTPAPLRLVGCLRGRSGSTSERLTSPCRPNHLERRWLAQRWVLTRTEEVMGRPRHRVESQVSCPKPVLTNP